MLKTPVATIFFGVTIGILIRYTHACVVSTPYNGALAIINLVLTIIGLIDRFIFGPVVRGDTCAHTSRPLTQDEIDSIPLVHYIPPGTASIGPTLPSPQNAGSPSLSQNPKTGTHRFSFFRSHTNTAEEQEQGLPYVVLQDNLAACSICCSDFEAPPASIVPPAVATSEDGGEAHELSVAVRPGYRVGELEVRIPVEPSLVNAGAADGAERTPLRLLGCGHAFHKECIDQWLGQKAVCPNCMTPVRTTSAMFKGEVGSRRATV
ncbi:hypothetical protein C2E23DRAFT_409922 [Lenzites betulinus]|nr:hypothetical protein C2E23DRAFT_409922 [Lenzites betulinus]